MKQSVQNDVAIGETSDGWQTEPLKYNSYIKGRIGWQNLRSDEFIDEGPYLVTGMHFQSGKVDWSSCYHISEERYNIAPEIQLKVDDVLITKDGTIGKLAYIDELPGLATLNSHLLIIRPMCGKYNPKFLYFCLSSHDFKGYCDINQSGTTFFGVTQETIENFPLWLPPLTEQTAIATFLDRETAKIDALVDEQKRLIELLKEKRQAVISHAVTKGLNPGAPMKDSGIEWLGKVPEHWDFAPLKRWAVVQTGVAKGKDLSDVETITVPYLRVANVQDGYIDLEDVATIDIAANSLERYRLRQGDVLMNEGGDFDKLGRGHVWDGLIDPCVHQNHVFAVRPHGVRSEWLNYFTSSSPAQFYFVLHSKQSTNLASISSSNLMELPVPKPPADEQDQIVRWVQTQLTELDALGASVHQSIELLQERRSALISAAITGKIDVRSFYERVEAA